MVCKTLLLQKLACWAASGTRMGRDRAPLSNPNGLVEIIRHGLTNIVVAILDNIWDVKPPSTLFRSNTVLLTKMTSYRLTRASPQRSCRQQVPASVVGIGGQQLRIVAGAWLHDFSTVQAPIDTLQGQRQG
jgi:hypothetical protein